jgi:hypothetical protein
VSALLVSLALACAGPAASTSIVEVEDIPTAQRVAVTDLDAGDVDPRLVRVATEALLTELRKLKGVAIIGSDEIRAMLEAEAQRQLVGCEEESGCLAEIAGALGADVLLVGAITDVGEERLLALKRIDQRKATVAQAYTARLSQAGGEEVLAAIGPAVEELFPEVPLREGKERGVGPELRLRLDPPPVKTWVFTTTAVSAGAATVIAGAALGTWAIAHGQYRVEEEKGLTPGGATNFGTLQTLSGVVNTSAGIAIGAGVLAGALTVTSVTLIPFVDWDNLAEE